MKKTTLLGLPIYDKPSEDKFKLNDWNIANENVERAFSSAINGKQLDVINTEVAEARGGELSLKNKINKIDVSLNQINSLKSNKTETQNIQSQVNSLVLGAVGSGNNAEVIQARVGNQGATFTTVKEHFDNIEKSFNKFVDKKYNYDWVVGTIASNFLITTANKYRIVTNSIQYASEDIVIKTNWNVYRVAYHTYSDNVGSNPIDNGWKSADIKLSKGTYFRLIVAYNPDKTDLVLNSAFGSEFFENISIEFDGSFEYLKNSVVGLENAGIKGITDYVDKKYLTNWVIGSIASSGLVANNVNRVVMKDIIYADKDLKVSCDWTKYRVGYTIYTNDSDTSENSFNGWKTSNFEIKKGIYFRLQVARFDGQEVPLTEVYGDMFNSLTVGFSWSLNRLKEIAEDLDINPNVNSINHRGYNWVAPENTIPAYKLSYKKGFRKFEADIAFTKDNIPVLLHDNTINRTARNADGTVIETTIDIKDINYNDLLVYDFGAYKGTDFVGTKIPKFEEFIKLCKNLGCHPYIEVKRDETHDYTREQIKVLVDIVKKYGMLRNVSWISFHYAYFPWILEFDKRARIGFVMNEVDTNRLNLSAGLKTDYNDIFIDVNFNGATESVVSSCIEKNIPLEVWGINSETAILSLNPYVSGVTADVIIAGNVLMKSSI